MSPARARGALHRQGTGEPPGEAVRNAAKPPEEHRSPADTIDYLCDALGLTQRFDDERAALAAWLERNPSQDKQFRETDEGMGSDEDPRPPEPVPPYTIRRKGPESMSITLNLEDGSGPTGSGQTMKAAVGDLLMKAEPFLASMPKGARSSFEGAKRAHAENPDAWGRKPAGASGSTKKKRTAAAEGGDV